MSTTADSVSHNIQLAFLQLLTKFSLDEITPNEIATVAEIPVSEFDAYFQ